MDVGLELWEFFEEVWYGGGVVGVAMGEDECNGL